MNNKECVQEYMKMITETYETERKSVKKRSLRMVADEFDITLMKARKILITTGAYHSDICD